MYFFRNLFILLQLIVTTNCFAGKIVDIDMLNAPDNIDISSEDGNKYSLDRFEGKTILLVFWATWCSSCKAEIQSLDILQKDFRKLPFEIVALSQDFQGIEIAKKYFAAQGVKYIKAYHDHRNQLFNRFNVVGLPTSFLINQDGKIITSFTGSIDWYDEEIRDRLLKHIPGNLPAPKNSNQDSTKNFRSLKDRNNPPLSLDSKEHLPPLENESQETENIKEILEGNQDDNIKK